MNNEEVRLYLPEENMIVGHSLPDREFFLGVLSTLQEDYVRSIVDASLQKCFDASTDDQHKNVILVEESWAQELLKLPYHSCNLFLHLFYLEKKGRCLFLMKDRPFVRAAWREHPINQDYVTKRRRLDDGRREDVLYARETKNVRNDEGLNDDLEGSLSGE
jgi:hypothetical protein